MMVASNLLAHKISAARKNLDRRDFAFGIILPSVTAINRLNVELGGKR